MTDPKTPDDVIDAELVDPHAGRAGNRAWMTGGNGEGRGPLKEHQRKSSIELRHKIRSLICEKGLPELERYIDDKDVDPSEKMAVILKAMEFALPKAKAEDVPGDGGGQGGGETRTMVVTFVAPKKDGGN